MYLIALMLLIPSHTQTMRFPNAQTASEQYSRHWANVQRLHCELKCCTIPLHADSLRRTIRQAEIACEQWSRLDDAWIAIRHRDCTPDADLAPWKLFYALGADAYYAGQMPPRIEWEGYRE